MAAPSPSISVKLQVGYVPDTGGTTNYINDRTERTYTPSEGFALRTTVTLDAGATNVAYTLADDICVLVVEDMGETTDGVVMKIGATNATANTVAAVMLRSPQDVVLLAAGTVLYFTNNNVSQTKVAITTVVTVP